MDTRQERKFIYGVGGRDTNWGQVKEMSEWENRKQDYGGHRGLQKTKLKQTQTRQMTEQKNKD